MNSIGQNSVWTKILGGPLPEEERYDSLRNPWIEYLRQAGNWCKVSTDHRSDDLTVRAFEGRYNGPTFEFDQPHGTGHPNTNPPPPSPEA